MDNTSAWGMNELEQIDATIARVSIKGPQFILQENPRRHLPMSTSQLMHIHFSYLLAIHFHFRLFCYKSWDDTAFT